MDAKAPPPEGWLVLEMFLPAGMSVQFPPQVQLMLDRGDAYVTYVGGSEGGTVTIRTTNSCARGQAVSTREPQVNVFLESGTWTKPEGATWVRIELRAGDGGPAAPGEPGAPGSLAATFMRAEWLPDAVAVSVGGSGGVSRGERVASGDGWARVTTFFDERQWHG